ncbi:MAG: 2-C-methyl-D-erythritol 2,4-cyclodiphosphate synthase [Planctomycetota bacterium]
MNPLDLRIGIGHDTHRLVEGGRLVLGGIEVPHTHSLDGHSDADVLLHAVTDALLGAASMGDIGELFPNTEAKNKDRDSAEMLAAVVGKTREHGYSIVNLDCILFAQRPKLSPFKSQIAERIAQIVGIEPGRVGVKAKTGESVGPVGMEQAMQAQCVALLVRSDSKGQSRDVANE